MSAATTAAHRGWRELVDHRRSGSTGSFFGNGPGSSRAVPFVLDVEVDPATGRPVRLAEEDPATTPEPVTDEERLLLDRAGDAALLAAWRSDGRNTPRARCEGGALPRLTTWVDGVLVAGPDTSKRLGEHDDHVLHPDGARVLMSAADGHVYAGARTGGAVIRLTPDDGNHHFLHGVSPDGTLGHPADVDVEVRVVQTGDWSTTRHSFAVPGGQGTVNVNSWAPDGRRFAFVSYPTAEDPA